MSQLMQFDRTNHVFRSPTFVKVVSEAIGFFINSPIYPLPPLVSFTGAGVYALYYQGEVEFYVNQVSLDRPIYAGKAVPLGWRQGRNINTTASTLFNRLREHSNSIQSTDNLKITDFSCRFMILEGQESNLISTVESELIRKFTPLWNSTIDGFGNHDPGSGRYNQSLSEWDVLHPGRSWAKRLLGKSPIHAEILAKIQKVSS